MTGVARPVRSNNRRFNVAIRAPAKSRRTNYPLQYLCGCIYAHRQPAHFTNCNRCCRSSNKDSTRFRRIGSSSSLSSSPILSSSTRVYIVINFDSDVFLSEEIAVADSLIIHSSHNATSTARVIFLVIYERGRMDFITGRGGKSAV